MSLTEHRSLDVRNGYFFFTKIWMLKNRCFLHVSSMFPGSCPQWNIDPVSWCCLKCFRELACVIWWLPITIVVLIIEFINCNSTAVWFMLFPVKFKWFVNYHYLGHYECTQQSIIKHVLRLRNKSWIVAAQSTQCIVDNLITVTRYLLVFAYVPLISYNGKNRQVDKLILILIPCL
jgi:hypothetical protein